MRPRTLSQLEVLSTPIGDFFLHEVSFSTLGVERAGCPSQLGADGGSKFEVVGHISVQVRVELFSSTDRSMLRIDVWTQELW